MHPIVRQLEPSEEQLPSIEPKGIDVVLTAGAGTGKTRTLVARMLAQLAAGTRLRRIVAVTFTTKAAREMRNRVRREIQRYLERSDLDAGERDRWDDLYRELDAARIDTIHGLCGEILRNHPAEAGVDPRFAVLDESSSVLLRAEAVERALAWATDDPDGVRIFTLLSPSALRDCLAELLAGRLKAQETFDRQPWTHWPARLEAYAAAARAYLDDPATVSGLADLTDLRSKPAWARAEAEGDKLVPVLEKVLAIKAQIDEARDAGDWSLVARLVPELAASLKPKSGRAAAWQPAAPKEILETLKANYELLAAGTLSANADPRLDRELLTLMPLLKAAFAVALDGYTAAKRERSALDFDDLEQAALDLLRDDAAVRHRWQEEIDAILVDEFQDTNRRQRDLVRLLNGAPGASRGGIFIVGDAKQSIYRFRGAEVQVFRGERDQIEAMGGAGYALTRSYRSHRQLLEALNALLADIVGLEGDPARPWHEPFTALEPDRNDCALGLPPPYVELHLAVGSQADGALQVAAAAVARRILELVSHARGRLAFGDIAVLCRSYRGFAPYEDAFDAAGIPYMTVAGRGFYERPEVRDLLNALQAIADPTDDLALVGLLRSPAIGFVDAEIHRLHLGGDREPGALWRALAASDGPEHAATYQLIRRFHLRAGRTAVADLLKRFVDETGYQAALHRAGQFRAARNVAKLLDDAQRSGLISVGDFLEYVRNLRDVGSREGEARADDEGAVQIMTVHQAKGLEFPVVVIGHAAGGGSRGGDALLLDEELGLVLNVTSGDGLHPVLFQQASARSNDMEEAESDRLLYVACTRARDRLLISGNVTLTAKNNVSTRGWLKQIAASCALSSLDGFATTAGGVRYRELAAGGHPIGCSVYEAAPDVAAVEMQAAPAPARDAAWTPHLLAPIALVSDRERPAELPARVWRVVPPSARTRAPAWVVGKLVHAAIAAWRFPGDGEFDAWLAAQAKGYGLAGDALIEDAVRRTSRLLARFRSTPLFRSIAAATRFHEVPYTYVADGELVDGRIDLIFRPADAPAGSWTVVDFKSDRIPDDRALEQWLDEHDYRAQMHRYAAAVAALLGSRPRLLLCLLDHRGAATVKAMDEAVDVQDASAADEAPGDETETARWDEALQYADASCHTLLAELRAGRAPAPQVGYDVVDSCNRVRATAELAWPERCAAVLLPGDGRNFIMLGEEGWRAWFADDTRDLLTYLRGDPA